jgi:hypothetical protein
VARRFAQNPKVRKRKTAPRMRSTVFMFMPRGPNLKLLPLVCKVMVVVKRAILLW